jgi:group II intron reverse transcriptase/maturase
MGRLFDQVTSLDNLFHAWEEVLEKKSAPGSDGVSLEDFARAWEANLVELRQEVRGNRYRPAPLLKFTIPKRDGSPRLLANLTVRDKVLQRAMLRVLDEQYEHYFLECSFAYRPRRSVQQAVETVVQAQRLGRGWVLDADIDEFFHSLDHRLLGRFLRETIDDQPLLRLIETWLQIGRPDPTRAAGTPLGAVISPLLSNIYLHYLDLAMTHTWPGLGPTAPAPAPDWVFVRYADDFVVLCRSQAQAELALQVVQETLETLRLKLEPTKTSLTTFEQGFEYLGCTFVGDTFYFEREGERIKVADDHGWGLFYTYGPAGYE